MFKEIIGVKTMRILTLAMILALASIFPFAASAQDTDDNEVSWDGVRFELESLDGDDMNEEDVFSGADYYIVDFWATWCRPCSQYLPQLESIASDYEGSLKIVLFSVDDPGNISTARAMLGGEDYPFTILFDVEKEIQRDLGVARIPTSIIFDASGEEVWRHIGYEHGDEEEVRAKLVELIGEVESPAEEE
jgi:thiol-disulfide isomerase/thioredoxin